jgi:hypothetical protein
MGIMLNVNLGGEDLLKTLAHECFHLHQDAVNPPGWRSRELRQITEGQAEAWVEAKILEIRSFLNSKPMDPPNR